MDIINTLADLLERREGEILKANQLDLKAANDLAAPLKARLTLDTGKLKNLQEGTYVHTRAHTHARTHVHTHTHTHTTKLLSSCDLFPCRSETNGHSG